MIEIRKVEKGTELHRQLREYVDGFSWLEVKDHVRRLIDGWAFTEWETPFAALSGDRIVAMATLMKTDYYPLPEIFPWISTIFVSEEYRGQRISGLLIDFANEYAVKCGFERTYIPSEHTGLYEKYGYRCVKDIKNYAGGTDRLYVRELKRRTEL